MWGIISFLGSLGIGIYIDTIIKSLNSVDKSLIFWHLIFLFGGMIFLVPGIFLVGVGVRGWNKRND